MQERTLHSSSSTIIDSYADQLFAVPMVIIIYHELSEYPYINKYSVF